MNQLRKLFVVAATLLTSVAAFAQEAGATATSGNHGLIALAAGLAIGMGVLGGTLGQGNVASKALEGISRNPAATDKMFVPLILSLALIESLVILSFIIAFLTIPGLR